MGEVFCTVAVGYKAFSVVRGVQFAHTVYRFPPSRRCALFLRDAANALGTHDGMNRDNGAIYPGAFMPTSIGFV